MLESWTIFAFIRWQDVLDIALNSYILFRLYVLFRETNAYRIIVGLALLWIAQRLAVFLDLIITSWAIQGITAVVALIIIIVFRNEIRNVLQATDLRALLWDLPTRPRRTAVERVVEGVYELAHRRWGALLVFPGREDISELVQNGLPWNGSITKEMILSIFYPGNPVHDGAAIIRGERIFTVANILPLSHRQDLPSYYGTRHRAAAGLAESSDALVVVVSEERGNVAAAKGSRLIAVRDNIGLNHILSEHQGGSSDTGRSRRRENLKLGAAALACLLFVVMVWFSFARGLESLITLEVPVSYRDRDPRMEIVDTSVQTVEVYLSGSGTLLHSVGPDQVRVRVDLGRAVVGRNSLNITPDNIVLPPGIRLKEVVPSVVEVTLDVPVRKELPIQIDWSGKLPAELLLVRAEVDPVRVTVIGGSRILEKTATIYTQKVPLDTLRTSGTLQVELALTPASIELAPDSKPVVTVLYVIRTASRTPPPP